MRVLDLQRACVSLILLFFNHIIAWLTPKPLLHRYLVLLKNSPERKNSFKRNK